MDALKKYFPLSFGINTLKDLIIKILIFIVVDAICGVVIGLLAKIPVLGIIFGLLGSLVGLYALVGVVLSILVFVKDLDTTAHGYLDFNDLIRRANEAGFLAQYNHPFWSTQTVKDFGPLEGLWGFEVFNGGSQALGCRGWGDQQFVEMMWEGKYLCPTAGDDNHGRADDTNPRDDAFLCFTMIRAEKLEYNTVLKAMEEGQLYASTGPTIEELYVEDGVVHIKTSPACKIMIRQQYRGYQDAVSFQDDLTEATFDLSSFKLPPRYIRFEVWDTHNERAITRAFFPEEWA